MLRDISRRGEAEGLRVGRGDLLDDVLVDGW